MAMKVIAPLFCWLILLMACRSTQPVVEAPSPTPTAGALSEAPAALALLARAPGDEGAQPLHLRDLTVEVALRGPMAITRLDLTFYNHSNQELEGTFFLPLLSGQTVDSLAMEVGGELRYAVMVDPQRGREAYQGTVQRRIDPALMEWAAGHNFQTRVYPIPARGTKRLRLVLHRPLIQQGDAWRYALPLALPDTLQTLRLQLTSDSKRKPEGQLTLSTTPTPTKIAWEKAEDGFRAQARYTQVQPQGPLRLNYRTPRSELNDPPVMVHTDGQGNPWFAAWFFPPKERRPTRPDYQRIGLLWDVSLSARGRDLERELAWLGRYLAQWTSIEVRLIPFARQVGRIESFTIRGGDMTKLAERLRTLRCDGATHLAALDLGAYGCDAFVLSSDGLGTWQGGRLRLGEVPVHPLHSYDPTNEAYLRQVAQQTGGQWVDLTATDDEAPLPRREGQRLALREAEGAVQVSVPVWQGEAVLLTGRLTGRKAGLVLRWQQSDGSGEALLVEIDREADAVDHALPQRLWARQQLSEQWLDPRREQAQVARFAQEYQLLSPYTSLLILDRLEDYLRYEITPPTGPLRDRYRALLADRQQQERLALLSHLDQTAEQFLERVAWWKQTFDIPPGPYQADPIKKGAAEEEVAAAESPSAEGSMDFFNPLAEPEPAVGGNDEPRIGIELQGWQPNLPYVDSLRQTPRPRWEEAYLRLRETYGDRPAFYADAAESCFAKGKEELGLRILSNLAELRPGDVELLRVMAYRLDRLDSLQAAEQVFRQILALRPEEPQSHRDLGLNLARQGQYQEAIERLYRVVQRDWGANYPEIGVLVAHEINALLGRTRAPLDLSSLDPRFVADMPTDLRVVLSWDAREVDLDLWVIDPRGEKCYYQNRLTTIGGLMSADFTEGYGPEEFLLKKAMPGTYRIQANYYANKRAGLAGPATLKVRLIRHYGRPNQTEESLILRLGEENEVVEIGTFEVE